MFDIKQLEENRTENNLKVLEHKREELFQLRQKELDGMIVRSRTKWLCEGEKNTEYYCNLEKRNVVQKAMCFTQNGEGYTW